MEWKRGEPIGHGSFGTVNLAIPKSDGLKVNPLMAVKSCGVSHSSSLKNEKFILDQLRDCSQIITCFGDSLSFENGEKLYNVLLEYAAGGSLADKLRNSGNPGLPESDVRRYTKSILSGIHCVHKIGYVHCDIKPQNVLLQDDAVKIADFGLAKKVGVKGLGCELRGTPLYMSPEMVVDGEHESPADIWALGCVVAEMMTGAPAWSCRRDSNVGGLLMRIAVGEEVPEIPEKLSEEGKDFLGKCFVRDSRKRWTAEMLLEHPFVAGHDDDVSSKDTEKTSPRTAFDFPDWVSVQSSMTCSITSLSSPEYSTESEVSPANRLRQLATDDRPDWCVCDSWVTVR